MPMTRPEALFRVAPIALLLVATACAGPDSEIATQTTTSAITTTVSTNSTVDRAVVPSAVLINDAARSGGITQLDADLYATLALFGGAEAIPARFLIPEEDAPTDPPWVHAAPSRVLGSWDELSPEMQARLAEVIPTFAAYGLGGSAQGLRARDASFDCLQVHPKIQVCRTEATSTAFGEPQLVANANYLSPLIAEAAIDAYDKFAALLPTSPAVTLSLANLGYSGGYIYGFVPDATSTAEHCDMFLDVLLEGPSHSYSLYAVTNTPGVPDGVPQAAEGAATTAHELFHCFQRANGVSDEDWIREGTATWSEHHVAVARNTEHRFAKGFVELFNLPFLARSYDASYAYLYADLNGGGAQSVIDMMLSGSPEGMFSGGLSSVYSGFPEFWHQVSVDAWNQEPVDVLDDSGPVPGAPLVEIPVAVAPEDEGFVVMTLAPYTHTHRTIRFPGDASEQALVDFARLRLDLSQLDPSRIRVSALAETAAGWLDPELLVGPERTFCRIAVGSCNDVTAESIHPYQRIVLIATNVTDQEVELVIPWNTLNPHLHGSWLRTAGPLVSTSLEAPYEILDTTLRFDEPAFRLSEDTSGNVVVYTQPGWACSFAGAYEITGDPTYETPDHGTVSGTVAITGPGSGSTFTNDCVYTSQGGPNPGVDTEVSGLHVPVVASPSQVIGFEIEDYDTLVVYAFQRTYTYVRTG